MDAKKLGAQLAYPLATDTKFHFGLSKREAFAMAAMACMLNREALGFQFSGEECAKEAVGFADLLLAELAKDQP